MVLPPVLERFVKVLTVSAVTGPGGDVPAGDEKADSAADGAAALISTLLLLS